MRLILALPLLALAGCDVDNDSANDSVRFEYNEQRIRDAAAATAGRAVKEEVGDIDVDVDVNRNRSNGATANEAAAN